jgi:uncharacterized membrane protein
MSQENVISVRLPDAGRADAVHDALRDAARAGKLGLNAAVTVEVAPDGSVHVGELREAAGEGMRRTGTLGGLLGVLGGPIGMVVGWGIGTRVGEHVDAADAAQDEDAIVAAVHQLPPGSVAVVAEIEEEEGNEALLDELLGEHGGTVLRRPADVLLDELEAEVARGEGPAADGPPATSRQDRVEALRARLEA